jgi:hypothetical protein
MERIVERISTIEKMVEQFESLESVVNKLEKIMANVAPKLGINVPERYLQQQERHGNGLGSNAQVSVTSQYSKRGSKGVNSGMPIQLQSAQKSPFSYYNMPAPQLPTHIQMPQLLPQPLLPQQMPAQQMPAKSADATTGTSASSGTGLKWGLDGVPAILLLPGGPSKSKPVVPKLAAGAGSDPGFSRAFLFQPPLAVTAGPAVPPAERTFRDHTDARRQSSGARAFPAPDSRG